MDNIKKVIIILLPVVLYISCIEPVRDFVDGPKTMLIKKNLIGISGITSETPYVEIQHCVDDGTGKILLKSLWYPRLIGSGANL